MGLKKRANLFNWRGQFTPEFVEYIISSLDLKKNALIADPFAGSGTVLIESAVKGFSSVGYEINPAAYQMACFYKYSNLNLHERNQLPFFIKNKLSSVFTNLNGQKVYIDKPGYRAAYKGLIDVSRTLYSIFDKRTLPFFMNMLFLSEKDRKMTVSESLKNSFHYLEKSFLDLPLCNVEIKVHNSDARNISIHYPGKTDLILTSPPYINVFNYHQNYRAVTESFGYDILGVAHSEFGSNRKNRGNRLLTVVQYCLDMESSINNFWHTLKDKGKLVMIVGRESNVRKTPFYNSEIIEDLITSMGGFGFIGKEERSFSNKYGKMIFEDILFFEKSKNITPIPKNAYLIAKKGSSFIKRQKGQLKLDNSIIEEFLIHLVCEDVLKGLPDGIETGSQTAFMSLIFRPSKIDRLVERPEIVLKQKDQDFTIGKSLFYQISPDEKFDKDVTTNGKLFLSVLAAEVKVNYDKTMFQECAGTASRLKQGCPLSKYYVLVEYLDMKPEDVSLTDIDNVFILRKAKRLPFNKRNIYEEVRDQHKDFPISSDVMKKFVNEMQDFIISTWYDPDEALKRGSFS